MVSRNGSSGSIPNPAMLIDDRHSPIYGDGISIWLLIKAYRHHDHRLIPSCRDQSSPAGEFTRLGQTGHHMGFGGTFTLDHETFNAVLRCLIDWGVQRQPDSQLPQQCDWTKQPQGAQGYFKPSSGAVRFW